MHELESNLSFVFFPIILVYSVLAAVSAYSIRASEEGRRPTKGCRYHSYTSNLGFAYFPLITFVLFVDLLLSDKPTLSFLPPLIIMGVFQCILLVLQPLLRKLLTARACASLWRLLSLALIFSIRTMRIVWRGGSSTLLTIPLPFRISLAFFPVLIYVWLAGFVGILVWHTVTHLRFRRKLLNDAQPAESAIMHVWAREEAMANIPVGSYRVMTSSAAQTPMSIGLFRSSLVVVLPEKAYTEEELKLLLRHELIHVCRRDYLAKFSILFLTALFWFNPLMWIAMHCCADDLELSCDETVLHGYDSTIRRRYANLLLNTAADQRGFTTCLSASARALRYRLKNVIIPRKRLTGGIVVGLLTFLLFFSCIFVNISYNPGTAKQHLFKNEDPQNYSIYEVWGTVDGKSNDLKSPDNPELVEYLFGLEISPLMRDFGTTNDDPYLQIQLDSQDLRYTIRLCDDYLRAYVHDGRVNVYYRIDEPLDWAFLSEAMEIYP